MGEACCGTTNVQKHSTRSQRKTGVMNQLHARRAELCLLVCVFSAVFIALDPFHLSILSADPTFQAKRVPQPPLSVLHSFPRDLESRLSRSRRWSVGGLMGPESIALDPSGGGPYTGVADGRIMKWHGPEVGWREFAYSSKNRSKDYCDQVIGAPLPDLLKKEATCGRPLGLRFHKETGDLYIADAYFGLLRVGVEGGQAEHLVNTVQGRHLTFTNDLDVASDGSVYFTDSSSKYYRRNFFLLVLSGDDSGRVLKYNIKSGETSVVIEGLQFPNGVTLNKDESFLVISESVTGRLLRHWLKGPRAGETEVLVVLPGYPDNVRLNSDGDLWVAMHCRRNWISRFSGSHPWLRRAFLQLPLPFTYIYKLFHGISPHGILAKCTTDGDLEVFEDVSGSVVKYASEVDEHEGQLWIGSILLPYISVYDLHKNSSLPDNV